MIKALSKYVLVEAEVEKNESKSGLALIENKKEVQDRGIVISIGGDTAVAIKEDNGASVKVEIKVGDMIVFNKYSAVKIKVEEKEYLVIKSEDIFLVVEKSKNN